jgi:FkbM family methyltransferase
MGLSDQVSICIRIARKKVLANTNPSFVQAIQKLIDDSSRLKVQVPVTLFDGDRMYVDPSFVATYFINGRKYEPLTTAAVVSLLKPGMVALDIGAHEGYFSLVFGKYLGTDGLVFSFEPESRNHALLWRNIKINRYERVVFPIRKAVADRTGRQSLFIDSSHPGCHSLVAANVVSEGTDVTIPSICLDDFAQGLPRSRRIGLIKMDVQGAEGLVLRGAEAVLNRDYPIILMEFWPYGMRNAGTDPSRTLEALESYGYRLRKIISESKKRTYDGRNLPVEATAITELVEKHSLRDKLDSVNLLLSRTD